MAAAIAVAPTLTIPSAARASTLAPKGRILVLAGETLVLQQATQVSQLTVEEGGTITAPPGSSLTLTVNSVETGSQLTALTDSGGVDTPIGPGTYRGDVVLTVAAANTPQAVASLNEVLALGLTGDELAALPERPTVINSGRFGVMWQGTGSVHIDGGDTGHHQGGDLPGQSRDPSTVTVDGSQGARLSSENGIIFQLVDNDNPGRVNVEGKPWSSETKGVYTEPTGDPERSSFDVTMTHSTDATASFTDISVRGDFNNSIRGGKASLAGMNLVLTFTDSRVEGVISATKARHRVGTITSAEYHELGTVTNTVQEVVNNGVIVDLAGRSTWTVAGTSSLSKLVVGSDPTITAAAGKTVAMTVDGTPTTITPGASYTGSILLSVG